MISAVQFADKMSMQKALLTLVGAVVSLILAIVLIWYSKKTIAKTMSMRHTLHMLKTKGMSGTELTDAARKCRSAVVSPKLVPVMLVKLLKEDLIQQTSNNRYAITTKGLESLKSLDSMSKEFQKVAKIVQKTSMISKFVVTEAIDRLAMISDNTTYGNSSHEMEAEIPAYGAEKQ